jgi:hypothetical protein
MANWVVAMSACTSLLLAACTGLSDRTYAYKLYPGTCQDFCV